jgi:hypothetical protein
MKKLILIALACSLSAGLFANKDGETRTATVKVGVSASDIIDIKAKYTELTVETWSKNEVEIIASIRFDGKMTDKVQKFLDEFEENVKNNISNSAGKLSIDTNLDEPNKVQIGGKHVGIIVSYGDKELKVSYKIKAPGTNKYTIASSYEDVRLVGSYDKIEFTQYSGDLAAGKIKSAKMNLKYGSATIESIESATMEIYEQKLNSRSIGNLEINTKYSDLDFRNVGTMEATSYESDIQIGTIKELKGNFKYGEININDKLENAKLTFYEMDMEGEEIGTLRLENSKYSNFDFEKVGSLVFDQSYEDETEINTLDTFKSLNSKYGNHSIGLLNGSLELNAYEDEVDIEKLSSTATLISIDGKYIDSSIGISDASFLLKANVKYGSISYDESKVNVRRYIKDDDKLEVEVQSKSGKERKPINIIVNGYEVDVNLN